MKTYIIIICLIIANCYKLFAQEDNLVVFYIDAMSKEIPIFSNDSITTPFKTMRESEEKENWYDAELIGQSQAREQNIVIKDKNGIIAKYLSDSLVVYVDKLGEEILIVPNLIYYDKGRDELIKELFSSLDFSNEDYGGKVLFFILFNDELQIQEIRVYEPLLPSYKANDLVIDKYIKYLEKTEGQWIRKEDKQKWYLYIFPVVI